MKFATPSIIFLTIICNALSLDINRLLWTGHHAQKVVEEAQLVEIIRWRQPICLQPAQGVLPCIDTLRKFQKEYEQFSSKRSGRGREELFILTDEESGVPLREEASGKLESPEIVTSLPLEGLQSSEEFFTEKFEQSSQRTSALTSEDQENPEGRYLIPPREMLTKHKQIYVTKVLDSPVTATLMAHNCLPDIGIPLCENSQDYDVPTASVPDLKPTLTISLNDESVVNERPTNSWEAARNPTSYELSVEAVELSSEASKPSIEKRKPEIIIKKPGSNQASTSFTLDGASTTQIPRLQHIVIHNNNRARFSDIIRKPFGNLLSSNFNFLEKLSQTKSNNQFTKPAFDAELTEDAEATQTIEKISSVKDDSSEKRKNPIFDVIYHIMNVTENSGVVQGISNFLHSDNQNKEESTAESSHLGIFGIFLNPANFLSRKKPSTTARPEVIVNIDPEVDVNIDSVAGNVDVKPAISADTNTESLEEVEPQVLASARPEITEDAKPEIIENVKPESSADVKPLFSLNNNTETSADVVSQVSENARPEIAEDPKSEIVEDARLEIIKDTELESSTGKKLEISTNVKAEVAADIKLKTLTDAKTEYSVVVKREAIAVDAKPEFSSDVRSRYSTSKKPEFSTDAKTKFSTNVKGFSTGAKPRVTVNVEQEIAEDGEKEFSTGKKSEFSRDEKTKFSVNVNGFSTGVKPRVTANVEQEIAEDGEEEFSTDAKTKFPTDVKGEFSTDAKPQVAVDVKPEISEYREPEVSIVEFLLPQSSTDFKPISFAEKEPKTVSGIEIIEVPEVTVKKTLVKILAKPENDVLDTFETLDITQQTQDLRDVESLLKPVVRPSLFVDLLTNSTVLIDNEMRSQ